MHTTHEKKDKLTVTGNIQVRPQLGHLRQKASRMAHKGSKRLKTRGTQLAHALRD